MSMVRALSPLERWYWIADRISPFNAVIRARVRGPLDGTLLERALAALVLRHPALSVRISTNEDGENPCFVPCPKARIELRRVAAPAGEEGTRWSREIDDHELRVPLDVNAGPLARAAWITYGGAAGEAEVHDLLLVFHHVIADGTTALSLLRQWLELIAELDEVARGERVAAEAPRAPVLPPFEELFPFQHRGLAGLNALVRCQARDQWELLTKRPYRLEPTAVVRPDERVTRFLHRELDEATVTALSERARAAGVTVHGALVAAMLQSAALDAKMQGRRHIAVGSPVDLRASLSPAVSGDDVGAYVATVPSFIEVGLDRPFWDIARDVSQDVAERKARGEPFAIVNLLRWVCPPSVEKARRFVELVESRGPGNLCVSNLGRYPFPDAIGRYSISEVQMAAGISVTGYLVAVINTSGGRLFWNFTYIDGAIPTSRAEALADASVAAVHSALR